ncbi:G2-specific serine/threonine protein kinase [Mortierella alpina]|nr:G2-specific serine/threonine protein kinase [Mortierella alpina]
MNDGRQLEGYEALESIGSGSFGLIRKVRRKEDGKILARKEIDYRKMSTKEKEQLVAEVNILKDLKHPNIVEFLERVIDRENSFIYILMEYCEGGDLATVIKRHKEMSIPIGEEFVWSIMTQLVLALHECHCGVIINEDTKQQTPRPILHRDLKPDNVFLDAQKNVKLGDFGLSRSLTNPQKAFAQTYVGTPFYMSPELINESVYDAKSDIWSLGCVVFEMCALVPPFLAETQGELSAKIRVGRIPLLPSQYSHELGQVVRAMLQVNPRKRPTTTDLLSNPRIKNISIEQELNRRAARLDNVKQALIEKDAAQSNRDAEQLNKERTLRSAEQTLREKETVILAREEATQDKEKRLIEYEQRLREYEQRLVEREQRLSRDRQELEDLRKEFQQEQERSQSVARKIAVPSSRQSIEPMMIDGKTVPSSFSSSSIGPGTSMESAINGNPNKQGWAISRAGDSYGNTKGSTTTSSLAPSMSTAASGSSMAGGASTADQALLAGLTTSRPLPRRKTGLSVGRYSLQTTNAFRSKPTNTNGSGSNGSSTVFSALDSQSGGTAAPTNVAPIQRPSSVMSTSSMQSANTTSFASKLFQGQPYTYNGPTVGKETRLSGRLGQVPGVNPSTTAPSGAFAFSSSSIDPQRMRTAKTRSTSSLAASLSSTTLSGAGPSASTASSSNHNPFLAPQPSAPAVSTSPSSSTAITSPSDSTLPGADAEQSPATIDASSHLLAASQSGSHHGRAQSAQSAQSNGSLSNRGLLGFQSQINGSNPSSSSSTATSSFNFNNYTSRRSNSSGLTAAIGSVRFTSLSGNATSSIPGQGSPSLPTATATSSAGTSTTNGSNKQHQAQGETTPPSKVNGSSNSSNHRPDDDEDLRMEWDDDIPSPFIKKTYMRPQSGSGGAGPVPFRNLSRS